MQIYESFYYQSLTGCSSIPSHSCTKALSSITLPSLYLKFISIITISFMFIITYLWLSSVANSYIQPSLASQFLQNTSLTMWRPVSMTLSMTSL